MHLRVFTKENTRLRFVSADTFSTGSQSIFKQKASVVIIVLVYTNREQKMPKHIYCQYLSLEYKSVLKLFQYNIVLIKCLYVQPKSTLFVKDNYVEVLLHRFFKVLKVNLNSYLVYLRCANIHNVHNTTIVMIMTML